ncbi:MAG: 50S ribosomal protein L23 [Candidatus Omnitrophota bacterium]
MYESPHDIIKSLLRTEKGATLGAYNKYIFWVSESANKVQVKKAVEEIFKVTVTKVNTLNMPGKPKRVRYHLGKTASWKKAVVTLKTGDSIDVASS